MGFEEIRTAILRINALLVLVLVLSWSWVRVRVRVRVRVSLSLGRSLGLYILIRLAPASLVNIGQEWSILEI